jgi:hypothetical protein
MWTFDEDVKCSFQGSGGHLAKYLIANGIKDVYQASRNALGCHWGTEYPSSQNLDDDQNSTVLEFLWAMMPLWQDINDLTQNLESITSDLDNRIEQTFDVLEQVGGCFDCLSAADTLSEIRIRLPTLKRCHETSCSCSGQRRLRRSVIQRIACLLLPLHNRRLEHGNPTRDPSLPQNRPYNHPKNFRIKKHRTPR